MFLEGTRVHFWTPRDQISLLKKMLRAKPFRYLRNFRQMDSTTRIETFSGTTKTMTFLSNLNILSAIFYPKK